MKTTSYEISKKLKEAGFEAETNFYWYCYDNGREMRHIADADGKGNVKSYDLETILESICFVIQDIEKDKNYWFVMNQQELSYMSFDGETNIDFYTPRQKNESLADVAGRMWLMLKKKGVIC